MPKPEPTQLPTPIRFKAHVNIRAHACEGQEMLSDSQRFALITLQQRLNCQVDGIEQAVVNLLEMSYAAGDQKAPAMERAGAADG